MRYILDKPANFNDIIRVILDKEGLDIDTTIFNKCGKPGEEAVTEEQFDDIFNGVEDDNELTCIDCGVKKCSIAQRCIIYALTTTVNQLKKSFSLDILRYLVNVINLKKEFNFYNISKVSTMMLFFKEQEEIGLEIPLITEKQLKLLATVSERVLYTGMSLYVYLMNKSLSTIITAQFALYLEAVGCDLKFLQDTISLNIENRKLINELNLLEKFFFKRNNKKGKGTPEMLEFCLTLLHIKQDIAQLKFRIKDALGGEKNPMLKKTYSETKYMVKIWKSIGFTLQRLTLTLMTVASQLNALDFSLVENYFGDEKLQEYFELSSKTHSTDIKLTKSNSYSTQIKNSLDATVTLRDGILLSVGTCHSIICDRLWKDFESRKGNKKRKAKFRLGEGSIFVLEKLFFETSLEEASFTKPTEENEEEMTEDEPKTFPIKAAEFKWYNTGIDKEIKKIFTQILEKKRKPKVAKGVRDTDPIQMCIKNKACNFIKDTFRKHGAVEIDTPVFELKDTLLGKYGEEGGKLIYDLKNQGGEELALRYDLTVPFARYCSTNNVQKIKRFHLGKVWRRDQPNFSKGRFREFHQCDIDIAGPSDKMVADSEILGLANEIMSGLGMTGFTIKVCDRRLLEAVIEVAGAPIERFKTICSSIDKLDKEPWEKVADELINEKGISKEAVDKLEGIVQHRGKIEELIAQLEEENTFGDNEKAKLVFEEFKMLSAYVKEQGAYDNIIFDLSLARGLDYYTGMIFEVVISGFNVGSLGGGGRYDGLIGMFSGKEIPSVGFSFGIERLFVVMEQLHKNAGWLRGPSTHVLVTTIGKGLILERIKLVSELWKAGINAEILYGNNVKPQKSLKFALENKIPYIFWLGGSEIEEGKVTVKCTYEKNEESVPRESIAEKTKELLSKYEDDMKAGTVVYEDPNAGKGNKKKNKKNKKKKN